MQYSFSYMQGRRDPPRVPFPFQNRGRNKRHKFKIPRGVCHLGIQIGPFGVHKTHFCNWDFHFINKPHAAFLFLHAEWRGPFHFRKNMINRYISARRPSRAATARRRRGQSERGELKEISRNSLTSCVYDDSNGRLQRHLT